MEIILLCLYGKVTVIVIFLIIYLYWIWKKVRLIKWEQAPGDTRDWIRNHEKNIAGSIQSSPHATFRPQV